MSDGWLCDSILKAAHQPSPTSTTPAFSPGGTITRAPVVGKRFKWIREDLYEQCSDHITEKTPSSTRFGSRPSSSFRRLNSSGVRLWAVITSALIDSMTQLLRERNVFSSVRRAIFIVSASRLFQATRPDILEC